ncbi:hypothetical protein BH09SUM1_BH09SUM1_24490 [soil metagenome]
MCDSAENPTEAESREIGAVFRYFRNGEDFTRAYTVIESQLTVIHARAQSLTQLAGVVVTVTGFSGRVIADTNTTAQWLLCAGLSLVVLAAAVCLGFVMPVRWVTTYMHLPPEQWLLIAIRRRQKKNNAFHYAVILLVLGLVLYIASISIMLMNPENAELRRVK